MASTVGQRARSELCTWDSSHEQASYTAQDGRFPNSFCIHGETPLGLVPVKLATMLPVIYAPNQLENRASSLDHPNEYNDDR
jgi:hypothetical protein